MRRVDWQERFSSFAKTRANVPFAWGSNDCCTFAAGVVEAITGSNPMATAEPYSSETGAARLIAEAGGLRELASAFLGVHVPPAFAAVGDVVMVENEGRQALGICNGTTVIGPSLNRGLVALDMSAALAAWKI